MAEAKDKHVETKLDIKTLEKHDNISEFYSLRLDAFRTMITDGENLTDDEIAERYPRFKKKPDFDDSNKQVFIAIDEQGTFVGLIYGQKEPDAAWIGDIQVGSKFKGEDISTALLHRFEQWAKNSVLGSRRLLSCSCARL